MTIRSKEFTHIGLVHRKDASDARPFAIRLRETLTGWYAGASIGAKGWPKVTQDDPHSVPCREIHPYSSLTLYLDLSTIRELTREELQEPLRFETAYYQILVDSAEQKLQEAKKQLQEAVERADAFDEGTKD